MEATKWLLPQGPKDDAPPQTQRGRKAMAANAANAEASPGKKGRPEKGNDPRRRDPTAMAQRNFAHGAQPVPVMVSAVRPRGGQATKIRMAQRVASADIT